MSLSDSSLCDSFGGRLRRRRPLWPLRCPFQDLPQPLIRPVGLLLTAPVVDEVTRAISSRLNPSTLSMVTTSRRLSGTTATSSTSDGSELGPSLRAGNSGNAQPPFRGRDAVPLAIVIHPHAPSDRVHPREHRIAGAVGAVRGGFASTCPAAYLRHPLYCLTGWRKTGTVAGSAARPEPPPHQGPPAGTEPLIVRTRRSETLRNAPQAQSRDAPLDRRDRPKWSRSSSTGRKGRSTRTSPGAKPHRFVKMARPVTLRDDASKIRTRSVKQAC